MADLGVGSSDTSKINFHEDYGSEFEFDSQAEDTRKAKHDDLVRNPSPSKIPKPNKRVFHDECSREQSRIERAAFFGLDAYTRHKKLINDYVLCYPGTTKKLKRDTSNYKTDHDVIRENHKFLWEDEDQASTWGQQLAKKYYDRLFKEYCITDLSRYKEKKVGMRWRIEKELILGKGQFFCGSVHCDEKEGLKSWEVNFAYVEYGEKKNALVKLRLCIDCSMKLNYGFKGKVVLKEPSSSEIENNPKSDGKVAETDDVSDMKLADHKEGESDIWKRPAIKEIEQSKEEAFEDFLKDMFL